MLVGRILGWILILLALAVLAWEVAQYVQTGRYQVIAAGQLWFMVDRGSLNLAQAVIQRYLHPAIWDPGITTLLLLPAWAVLGVPGILLAYLCRRRAALSPPPSEAPR